MLFIAQVDVIFYPYMESSKELSRNHTVEADDEDKAREKIENHYKEKSVPHGDGYSVVGIDIFEHIK